MSHLDRRTSTLISAGNVGTFVLTIARSIKTRGLRRTALFVALGVGIPVAGELVAIQHWGGIRHHLRPQAKGLPLAIACGWYNIGYNTFAMLESLAQGMDLSPDDQRRLLPLATALTATSLDLVMDVALLDQGYWEWRDGGPYATEIVGPNGQAGIPWANYTGWIVLTSLVTALYLRLSGDARADTHHAGTAARGAAGRIGALLLLPSYLAVLRWEVQQRRWRYVAYAVLFPIVVALALWGPDHQRRT